MKKFLLLIFAFFALYGVARANTPDDFNYIPYSSYTEVGTGGTVMLTSATVQFAGITISSPAPNSYIAIFRSTTPVFTANIASQAVICTDYYAPNTGPTFVDMFDMKNTSYTYINKVGTAKIIYWFRCPPPTKQRNGFCPGLPWNGSMDTKIEFQ